MRWLVSLRSLAFKAKLSTSPTVKMCLYATWGRGGCPPGCHIDTLARRIAASAHKAMIDVSFTSVAAYLALSLAVCALAVAAVGLHRSRRLPPRAYRELEGEARALIADLDSLAEKLSMQVARDARRRTAAARRHADAQPAEDASESTNGGDTSTDLGPPMAGPPVGHKARLLALAHARGLGRR